MNLGPVVRRLRKRKGLTLEQLSNAVGGNYDTGNLSRFERGMQGIDGKVLERIAEELGTPVSMIYAEAELSESASDKPIPARIIVDIDRLEDQSLKKQLMDLVSMVASGKIPRDRLDAMLKLLLG